MELTKLELEVVAEIAESRSDEVLELHELQLALVGGGIGETTL